MESAFNDTLIANVTTGTATAVSRYVFWRDSAGVRIDSTGELTGYGAQSVAFEQKLDSNGVSYLASKTAVLWPDSTADKWIKTSRITSLNYWDGRYGNGSYVIVGDYGIVVSNDGKHWQTATPVTGDTDFDWMWSIAYGNNAFVQVGNSGRIARSPDGYNWTVQTSPSISGAWSSIDYLNGLFLAGSQNGDLATSPDGVTWTSRISGLSGQSTYFFFYLNGLYFMTTSTGGLATSADAITWTLRTSSFGSDGIRGMAYHSGVFVAVGNNGKIAKSADGFTWAQQTSPTANELRQVVWFNGLFVARGLSGSIVTSPDGVMWTSRSSAFGTNHILTMEEFGGKLVVGGYGGVICTSTDGITWTSRASTISDPVVQFLNGGVRLVAACNTGYLLYSDDGITWAQEPVGAVGINCIGFSDDLTGNKFFASTTTAQTYGSKDAYTWEVVTNPITSGVITAYAKNTAGLLVAVANGGNIASTVNGTTWTQASSPSFSGTDIYGVACSAGGTFIAVGASGKIASSSTPTTTWTQRTSTFGTDHIYDAAWADTIGLFAAVGAAGKLATSPDGTTWTSRTSSFGSTTINSVAASATVFVAAAGNGSTAVASSADGITWTQRTNTVVGYKVAYGDGRFILFGNGEYATSPDGVTWTAVSSPSGLDGSTYYGAAFADMGGGTKLWVAAGTNGRIAVSAEGGFTSARTINGIVLATASGGNGVEVIDGSVSYASGANPPRLLNNSVQIQISSSGSIIGPTLSDRIVRSLAAGTISNDLTTVGALSCGLLTGYTSPSQYTEVSSAYHTDYARKANNMAVGTGHTLTLAQAMTFSFPLVETEASITHLAVFKASDGSLAWVVPLPTAIPSGTSVAGYAIAASAPVLTFTDAAEVAP